MGTHHAEEPVIAGKLIRQLCQSVHQARSPPLNLKLNWNLARKRDVIKSYPMLPVAFKTKNVRILKVKQYENINPHCNHIFGIYGYGGTDPRGIQEGRVWPYVKSLGVYKCPADNRTAFISGTNGPIVRSVSMNCWLAGRTYGDPGGNWNLQTGGSPLGALKYKIFMKDTEIGKPAATWVLVDEDPKSINDAMMVVDMESAGGLVDLPSRLHEYGYGINFADGHAEIYKFIDKGWAKRWVAGNVPAPIHGPDWQKLRDVSTQPW